MPIYNHGACVQNGRVYVWGGNTAKGVINTRVLSASFNVKGELGAWRDEVPMPVGMNGSACCGINDYIVSIGGHKKNGYPVSDIWFAHLEDGYVKSWQNVETNLQATSYHSLGLQKDNGRVFVTGGTNKRVSNPQLSQTLNTVQAFQIPQQSKDRLKLLGAGSGGGEVASRFLSMEAALAKATADKKTVLAFFYSPEVPACKRFWDNVVSQDTFQALGDKYVLSAVDSSQKNSPWPAKLGVFKVPSLVEVSADGKALKSARGLETLADVQAFLNGNAAGR